MLTSTELRAQIAALTASLEAKKHELELIERIEDLKRQQEYLAQQAALAAAELKRFRAQQELAAAEAIVSANQTEEPAQPATQPAPAPAPTPAPAKPKRDTFDCCTKDQETLVRNVVKRLRADGYSDDLVERVRQEGLKPLRALCDVLGVRYSPNYRASIRKALAK